MRSTSQMSKPTGKPSLPADPQVPVRNVRRPPLLGRRTLRGPQPIAFFYLLPAFAFFTAFALVPLAQTINLSFYEWNGITERTFTGFDNYVSVFTDEKIREALQHSLVLIVFYALFPISLALLIVGLMVRVRVRGLAWFRAVLFMPTILPLTVVAVAWRWIYAPTGPLNKALDSVGLDSVSRAWLGDFTFALPALGLVGTWVTFGLVFVLFAAGVQKIPTELYEAAKIDGAGAFREFLAVTLPALRGEITVAMVLTVTAALRNFDVVFVTTRGGPGTTTEVPSVFIYRAVFQTRTVGLGAAIGVVLMVELLLVNMLVLWYRRRGEDTL